MQHYTTFIPTYSKIQELLAFRNLLSKFSYDSGLIVLGNCNNGYSVGLLSHYSISISYNRTPTVRIDCRVMKSYDNDSYYRFSIRFNH